MKIGQYYGAMDLHREEKILYGHFLRPHRVLSTCRANGGLREDLEFLFNHQSCEPSKHSGTDLWEIAVKDPCRYHGRIAAKAGLSPEKSAGLGTAANMNNAAIAVERFRDLEVVAVSTAGVTSNACRAGDPASYYQGENEAVSLRDNPRPEGTINFLLFASEELTQGAMLAAASVVIESKAALLSELGVPSRYSNGIATGTGTDQLGIACLLGSAVTHTDANKHSKLGELIGLATRKSLQEALVLQCGYSSDSRRSCVALLQRFGEEKETFINAVCEDLSVEQGALFRNNFLSINHDPLAVAATQACAHLRDQIAYGILPLGCIHEILTTYAAQIARAVSSKSIDADDFRESLETLPRISIDDAPFLSIIRRAFALGFALKWEGRFQD